MNEESDFVFPVHNLNERFWQFTPSEWKDLPKALATAERVDVQGRDNKVYCEAHAHAVQCQDTTPSDEEIKTLVAKIVATGTPLAWISPCDSITFPDPDSLGDMTVKEFFEKNPSATIKGRSAIFSYPLFEVKDTEVKNGDLG
jgi:hypothetical protein